MDALLSHHFRHLLREEHERRMSDEDGSRRGVDIGNLLAGLVPGSMGAGSSNKSNAAANGGGPSRQEPQGPQGDDKVSDHHPTTLDSSSGRNAGQQVAPPPPASKAASTDSTKTDAVTEDLAHLSLQSQPDRTMPTAATPPPSSLKPRPEGLGTSHPTTGTTAYNHLSPHPHSLLNTNPNHPYASPQSPHHPFNSSFQHPQQRHLWDPARTGYGNGICFYDLALLHHRSGDDHGPCMCDLTACRTCFHELLYFRGRREVVASGPGPGEREARRVVEAELRDAKERVAKEDQESTQRRDGADDPLLPQSPSKPPRPECDCQESGDEHCPHRRASTQQGNPPRSTARSHPILQLPQPTPQLHLRRTSPLQIKHPDMADIMLVEEHLRTRLHYMANPDVVLRYGDEEEFIPPVDLMPVSAMNAKDASSKVQNHTTHPPPSTQPPSSSPHATAATQHPQTLAKPKVGSKKVIQGRKMKGGRVVKGGLPPKILPQPTAAELAHESSISGEYGSTEDAESHSGDSAQPQMKPRLNGSQLPAIWTTESASSRNMAVTLTYRHLVKVCVCFFLGENVWSNRQQNR